MNKAEFIAALEHELRLRGRAFSRADVQEFVADAWTLTIENPDVHFWVREFVNTGRKARRRDRGWKHVRQIHVNRSIQGNPGGPLPRVRSAGLAPLV
jgi:hypothetical protein